MLLPYTTLVYFGPAASASVVMASGSLASGAIGFARAGGFSQGVGSVPFATPTRLRGSVLAVTGVGSVVQALPKGRAKPFIVIRVNALSQDDVTGAVLESEIEAGFSMRKILRLMASVLLGKSTGGPGSPVFRNVTDAKARVTGTADASGNRSAASYDPD